MSNEYDLALLNEFVKSKNFEGYCVDGGINL